jgi:hypothetical protein
MHEFGRQIGDHGLGSRDYFLAEVGAPCRFVRIEIFEHDLALLSFSEGSQLELARWK